jgi:hypothetical protein
MPNVPIPSPILCDSCGLPASPDHIQQRMARLELATRHRPFHIGLLLVSTAPPADFDDDIYAWEQQSASPEAHAYIQSLLACVGVAPEKNPTAQLAELQHRGVYISRLVECPLPESAPTEDLAAKYGPTLVKRIAYSYKPRQIGLLAPVAPGLAELIRASEFGERLIADGKGIQIPALNDAAGLAAVRKMLSKAIAASEAP